MFEENGPLFHSNIHFLFLRKNKISPKNSSNLHFYNFVLIHYVKFIEVLSTKYYIRYWFIENVSHELNKWWNTNGCLMQNCFYCFITYIWALRNIRTKIQQGCKKVAIWDNSSSYRGVLVCVLLKTLSCQLTKDIRLLGTENQKRHVKTCLQQPLLVSYH